MHIFIFFNSVYTTSTSLTFFLFDNTVYIYFSKTCLYSFSQTKWGKHTPASSRTNHTSYYTGERKPLGLPPYQTTLAVVSIRDPYSWMQSMCRVSYAAQFDHDKSLCPNIKPYPEDIEAHPRFAKMKFVPVSWYYMS